MLRTTTFKIDDFYLVTCQSAIFQKTKSNIRIESPVTLSFYIKLSIFLLNIIKKFQEMGKKKKAFVLEDDVEKYLQPGVLKKSSLSRNEGYFPEKNTKKLSSNKLKGTQRGGAMEDSNMGQYMADQYFNSSLSR